MEGNKAFNQLIQMQCNPILCQAAIKNLKTQDLGVLLDWISDHSQEQQKWSKWLEENKEQKINQQSGQGMSITHLISKEFSQQLIKKGYSKNVAEKSLLLTNNTSLQSAQSWIKQHKYDVDFEEELRLTGQAFQTSSLTPEQAKVKLKELTQKARQNRKKRQDEEERERQKNRIRSGKEMIEAKRIAEEQAIKRRLELEKIQKQKDEIYKKQLIQSMRREKNQKLGRKQEVSLMTKQVIKEKQQTKLSKIEQLKVQCQQIRVGMHAYPDKAKVFFQTVQVYLNNILKNNGQQKYRRINLENKAFQSRIMQVFAGIETFEVIGYEKEEGSFILKKYDLNQLKQFIQMFQEYEKNY